MELITKAIITALDSNSLPVSRRTTVAMYYEALKTAILDRYGIDSELIHAIKNLENKPESAGRQTTLDEEIAAFGADQDPAIVQAAERLLKSAEPTPPPAVVETKSAWRPAVPVQRPAKAANFVNRTTELEQILAELKPGYLVSLYGPAGIGKGALVRKTLWQLSPEDEPPAQFPDGIIHYSFYTQPRADIALEEMSRTLSEEPIPSAYESAQRALAHRQALVVLEGVEQADDLPGILATCGDNCGILITTRHEISSIPSQIQVTGLPAPDATELLMFWSKTQNAGVAQQIGELVGFSPLALRLVGQYLSNSPTQDTDYLAWLNSTPLAAQPAEVRQEACLPLILEHNLKQISEAARLALAVASLLTTLPFTPEAISKTLNIEPNQGLFSTIRGFFRQRSQELNAVPIEQALQELTNYGLLEQVEDARYRVSHPAIHQYAKQHLTPPPRAIKRLASYFTAFAWEQSGEGPAGDVRLDGDRPHFMKVMNGCVENKEWEAAHSLAAAVEDFLDRNGYLADRVTANEIGLMASWQLGRPSEGAWLGNLGDTYRTMGHAKWAIEHFEKALATARKSGDRHSEGNSLGNLGLAYRDLGQIDQALDYLKQALAIFEEIRSPSAGLVRDWLYELETWEED